MKKILNEVKSRHFTICPHCGCHFTYDEADIELVNLGSNIGNLQEFSKFVECPKCQGYIQHSNNRPTQIETVAL